MVWRADMPQSDIFALSQSRYNDFLFARIGEELDGVALTVLSAFARLGCDPWQEAHRLAELSPRQATISLAQSIAALPCGSFTVIDAWPVADRLAALLPPRTSAQTATLDGMIAAALARGGAALAGFRRAIGL